MKRLLIAILLSLPIFVAAPATAQSEDEAAVRAVVTRLFDGMRAGDGSVFAQVFTPDARLQTAAVRRDGTPVLGSMAVDSFAAMVSQPRDFVLDERIDAWDVRMDGPLAVVTVDYSFYAGPRFSHCGIDAFQLFKSAEGWKIFQLTDTRRTTGCPPQTESRP
ncbi:nuclear transport factor 2 family protein [Longimicrobium sp.]|uniref:nuclear transport factor 2 family protein n=1 Tax=Longimicrobium sp. TaxID=2029185 RepID=UPI002E321E5B|nr:nuclear transport factor 2 family protein [Longimicrobium sp.]HEX6038688.1 nuclear transport factor 2 family protein [Longimicrobium sp.]